MKKLLNLLVGASLGLVLSGCYESPSVTSYQPGVYKGTKDPLLQSSADQRAEIMKKRFELVQMDR